MPRATDRPALLADAAIRVLAIMGAHRLTHRTVDAESGVPAGTASNHFRTRQALLEAAARRLLDQQLADLDQVFDTAPTGEWADLVRAVTAMVGADSGPIRTRYLARCELTLEAARNPALAEVVRQVRAASLRRTASQIRSAGIEVDDRRLDALGSLLAGVALERMTLGVPEVDLEALVEDVLRAFVGPGITAETENR